MGRDHDVVVVVVLLEQRMRNLLVLVSRCHGRRTSIAQWQLVSDQ